MSYDADATRQRIFTAATEEFAAHGLAGARIERIAAAACANKQAIYLYYGGKEKLFGAVIRSRLEKICHAVVIDPDALAESVGTLFDYYRDNPELVRLVLWEALETGDGPVQGEDERCAAFAANVRGLVPAGREAGIGGPDRVRATQDLMFTLLGLVAWNFAVPQMRRIVLDEPDAGAALERRRAVVIEAALTLAGVGASAR